MKKDYKELYEKITNSDWFKKAYQDKSLGECPIVVDELEESEDERIRKEILDFIQLCLSRTDFGSRSIALRKEDAEMFEKWVTYLEKKKEQKPTEWSEEDEKMLSDCIEEVGSMSIRGDVKTLRDWLKSLPERFNLQPKQEWGEEDERIMQTIIKEGDLKPSEVAWLKSLRPQSHWKPSKEQMEALYNVEFKKFKKFGPILESLYNDLKNNYNG